MWNNTDTPLAYLITFRTYGTWLHGDQRGSVNRFRNGYRTRRLPPKKDWLAKNTERLRRSPVKLNARQRASVKAVIQEVCKHKGWALIAINVRTNHVHLVVAIGEDKPSAALNAFKAYATKRMRGDGNWVDEATPWVDKGSQRYLWNERSVERAVDYVLYGQGDELPEFGD